MVEFCEIISLKGSLTLLGLSQLSTPDTILWNAKTGNLLYPQPQFFWFPGKILLWHVLLVPLIIKDKLPKKHSFRIK